MPSFTIHNLDEQTARRLRDEAEREGTSLNRLVKRLLGEAMGVEPPRRDHREAFRAFLGTWSREQAEAFEDAVAEMRRVDDEDWR